MTNDLDGFAAQSFKKGESVPIENIFFFEKRQGFLSTLSALGDHSLAQTISKPSHTVNYYATNIYLLGTKLQFEAIYSLLMK